MRLNRVSNNFVLTEEDPKLKERDPKSFVDDSIIKELDSSGFTKALYAR
ncbi:MAG: hypothetical protein ACREQ7_22625 [Candidatus Binatia bacterium]